MFDRSASNLSAAILAVLLCIRLMSKSESCPYQSCAYSDTLKRVLSHIREFHDPVEIPSGFVTRLKLQQCSSCQMWFSKIAQHISFCKVRNTSSTSNGSFESQRSAARSSTSSCSSIPATDHSLSASVPPLPQLPSVNFSQVSAGTSPELLSTAWKYIQEISADTILHSHTPKTVQTIKPSLTARFIDCCAFALQRIKENPSNVAAWKLFLLIPRMVLTPQRGGKHGEREANSAYSKFLNGAWSDLLQLETSFEGSKKSIMTKEHAKRSAALRLVRCGELSKAARILTSNGLAPSSAETIKKLSSKHPK